MINCTNFNENICAYLDNELSIEERLSFEEHAKDCRECKRELEEMTRIIGLCTSLPQYELPDGFQEELHEKLEAVAGRPESPAYREERNGRGAQEGPDGPESRGGQDSKVRDIRKAKSFRFLKTVAAVAAGVLVVFLAGSYFRLGLFSPSKTEMSNKLTMTAEVPAAQKSEAAALQAGDSGAGDEARSAGAAMDQEGVFAAKAVDPASAQVGSTEVDRSAAIQNRDVASAEAASTPETINHKIATISVTASDPNTQTEKIKQIALNNNGEIVVVPVIAMFSANMATSSSSDDAQANGSLFGAQSAGSAESAQAADSKASLKSAGTAAGSGGGSNGAAAPVRLDFAIPDTQYEPFMTALNAEYGAANVLSGALVTEDVTEMLNSSVAESIDLDNRIQALQKKDSSKNAAEMENLKAQKEVVDRRIDELRLGNDLISVTIYINGK